jgi:hypothetical protein
LLKTKKKKKKRRRKSNTNRRRCRRKLRTQSRDKIIRVEEDSRNNTTMSAPRATSMVTI